jgi:hypothetical protein
MRKFFFLGLALAVLCTPGFVQAQGKSLFKTYDPDIDKYVFTKNFILSVSYYGHVADRLKAEGEYKAKAKSDLKLIQEYIEDRTLDNTELRIARNYITRFTSSKNGLILKVSRQAIAAYDAVLALSMKERDLWQALYQYKSTGKPDNFDEEQFSQQQLGILAEKKEAEKSLLSASMLIRIVLLSAERCDSEDCKMLVLTKEERYKLIGYLDDFARDNMEWGIKAGQSPVEGCVAAIREVLEDQLYISKDK